MNFIFASLKNHEIYFCKLKNLEKHEFHFLQVAEVMDKARDGMQIPARVNAGKKATTRVFFNESRPA